MKNDMKKNVLEFLSAKNLAKNPVFLETGASENGGKILQFMLKNHVKNCPETAVFKIIRELFGANEIDQILDVLPDFHALLKAEWIVEGGFSSSDEDSALLDILHFDVELSTNFLKLLEGEETQISPKITPYIDQNEYLKDQFSKIMLLQKISRTNSPDFKDFRVEFSQKNEILSKTKNRIKNLENEIAARLKITKKPLQITQILKNYELNALEETIFFALLKEEYIGEQNLRDMNSLIDLISDDEYERIKNRALFDDKNTLIAKKILDYDEIPNFFGGFSKVFFVHDEILEQIFYPSAKKQKIELNAVVNESNIFEIIAPKKSLKDVVLSKNTRETIEILLRQIDPKVSNLLKIWGIKDKKTLDSRIIFYGKSGTGKTITALAIAKALKRQVLSLDCSKVLSMYVGESEKNVRKIFDEYKEIAQKFKAPPILLLDEADQFLSLRGGSGSSADKMHNQMQNIFLEQIEKFEGILIATTNLLETIDFAFSRRFNHKIEFRLPNEHERFLLWKNYLPKNAVFEEKNLSNLAKNLSVYALSGGQISLVVKNVAYKIALQNPPIFREKDFRDEILKELNSAFDNEKNMGFVARN